MSVYWSISRSACQVLVVFVRNVRSISRLVLLGQSKINHKDNVRLFLLTNQEIIRFDVSMQKSLVVNVLDSLQNLQTNHYDCFKGEGLAILLEQRLQRVSQWFHNHDILLSLSKVLINLNCKIFILLVFLCH